MNPTAGSFNITPRMQRHFVTFAVQVRGSQRATASCGKRLRQPRDGFFPFEHWSGLCDGTALFLS